MCQNVNSNCCQDYSLKTANTGVTKLNVKNPNLDGSGTLATVVTAGESGATIKSVVIKATGPVTTGMIRLFIQKANPTVSILYKEVQIPISPTLANTPIPAPVLPMYEILLEGEVRLESGCSLVASTQVGDSFNVFADAVNWSYPTVLPSDCCNFEQRSALNGLAIISTANSYLDGSGTIDTIVTATAAPNSGTRVKNITIKALQSTSINGMLRLFLSPNGGTNWYLMREIEVPQTTQSAYEPSFKKLVDLDFCLSPGYLLGMSTQNSESFGVTVEAEDWSYPIS